MTGHQDPKVELLLDLLCELGEAPTWDDRLQRFYFVDIKQVKFTDVPLVSNPAKL